MCESAETKLPKDRQLLIVIQPAVVAPEGDFPDVTIYGVELGDGEATWCETYGTAIETAAFLRGVQAGSAMTGGAHISIPAIPRQKLL